MYYYTILLSRSCYMVALLFCVMPELIRSGDFDSSKFLSAIEIENMQMRYAAQIRALTTKREIVYAVGAVSFVGGMWSLQQQLPLPAVLFFANSAACLIYCHSIHNDIGELYSQRHCPKGF